MRIGRQWVDRVSFCAFGMLLAIAGCASFQATSELQSGRRALIMGQGEKALAHFESVAEINPNYRVNFSLWREGIWSYIGRAYYETGQLGEAHKALDKAISLDWQDHLARLYLGLVLAQSGERRRSVEEMEKALQQIGEWLDYVERYNPSGKYWDPDRRLRVEIKANLVMLNAEKLDTRKIIANGEWIGRKLEKEIDRARDDKIDDLFRRDGEGGSMN